MPHSFPLPFKSEPVDKSFSAIKYCRMLTHFAFLLFLCVVNLYNILPSLIARGRKAYQNKKQILKTWPWRTLVTLFSVGCSLPLPQPAFSGKPWRQDHMSISTSYKLCLMNSLYSWKHIVKEMVVNKCETILLPNKHNVFGII